MMDAEVSELTSGGGGGGVSAARARPASPIIDIYGDEEDSYDNGGNINVDLQSPPSSPKNERHEGFFTQDGTGGPQTVAVGGSGVWNWFTYAKDQIDASLVSANNYLEDSPAIQATTNRIYSVGEEAHKKLAQAGAYTGVIGQNVVSQVQSYGQTLLSSVDLAKQRDTTPILLNIISDKHIDTSSIAVAFAENFSNTTCSTYDVVSGLSAQLVGPASALEGCKLRIMGARAQNLVPDDAVVVAVESFINEVVPGTWVEQYCMLVSDLPHEIDLHVFSQPVNVPTSLALKSKDATPTEYALRSSGYAKSIIEVISETFPDVNIKDWYRPFVGISNHSVLGLVSRLLAALFHQRLVNMLAAQKQPDVKSDEEAEIDVDAMERS